MTTILLIGIMAAFVATTLAAALGRAPTRTRCPACGADTVAVQPDAWLLKRMPDLRLRWCHACSWQGWGRHGAEWITGYPTAHDSGFRWGDDEAPENWGFRFADEPTTETSAEPPHHPSGFRFSAPPAKPRKAHPSGFSWADSEEGATETTGDDARAPGGFRWGPSPSERAASFAWGQREGKQDPRAKKGFNWKDVG